MVVQQADTIDQKTAGADLPKLTSTLRILQPFPGIYAYYDGRILGKRLHSGRPNWLDDGAYSLGIASYAIVDGREALVYDTHISLAHARAVRDHLKRLGATSIRVVLSHHHDDHVAGNEVFCDCEIIALELTAAMLAENRDAMENLDPPIKPLVMPNSLFRDRLDLAVGARRIQLHHFNIHSADGAVLWLPDERILFAGDTLEDTITFISEAQNTAQHIEELKRMRRWPIRRILPNHGDPERIAAGGYDAGLIDANRHYLERIIDPGEREGFAASTLEDAIADDLASGAISYFPPYESVHRQNIAAFKALPGPDPVPA
jgi:glyoxylase-like metal-dependent hydrolase (beta-lactamase superfamily II)